MKIRGKGIAILFAIFIVLSHAQWQLIPTIILIADIIKWGIDFTNYIKSTDGGIVTALDGDADVSCPHDIKYHNILTSRVVQAVSDLTVHIDEISQQMNVGFERMRKSIKRLGIQISINRKIDDLMEEMGVIDNLYADMERHWNISKSKKFDGRTMCNFAHRQLYGGGTLLTEKVDAMQNVISPTRRLRTSLLAEIFEDLEVHKERICDAGHSTLDYLHTIYVSLMTVEIEAYAMTIFSHNILSHFNGTTPDCKYTTLDPENEIQIAQTKFRQHLEEYTRQFLPYMEQASNTFRACDRDEDFIRDDTYFELEGAIQAVVHLPSDYPYSMKNEALSGIQCEDLNGSYGTPALWCDLEQKFCTTSVARNCLGYTRKCRSFGANMSACVAENSPRRYEWIKLIKKSDSDKDLEKCSKKLRIIPRDYHYWYYSNTCVCECNDNDVDSLSTHIFNLQWVESDVSKNMVITGIRFIVVHRIMQLQIQQGKLISNFRVNYPEWKSINDISEEIRAARLHKKLRGEVPQVVENIDYLILNEKINNAIDFDSLQVPHTYVLTGVRFFYSPPTPHRIGRIQIAIKGTKFDHITGTLNLDTAPEIVTSTISHTKKYDYPTENVNKPVFPTVPITQPGQYVTIDASDFEKDYSQTTLPYFDAIPLVSDPPTPLGGLGIFHKGAGSFTGFISLKFISLDHLKYMKKSLEEVDAQKRLISPPAL